MCAESIGWKLDLAKIMTDHKRMSRSPLFLVAAGTLLGFLMAEGALRLFMPNTTGYFLYRPGYERIFAPSSTIFPGVEGRSHFVINSKGVRADELSPEATYRVMALGGSTTECLFLDTEEAWPHRLQVLLNERQTQEEVWVGNFGKTGVSTREHRLQVPVFLDDFPEIDALILLVGVNDALLRLAREAAYDPFYAEKEESLETLLYRSFEVLPSKLENPSSLLRRTRLWGLLARLKRPVRSRQENSENPIYAEDDAGDVYVERRRLRTRALAIRDAGPDLASGLDEYERNLSVCVEEARRRSVRVILMTQPVLWDADLSSELRSLLWTGGVYSIFGEDIDYYSVRVLAETMRAYNDRLREFAGRWDLELIDLAATAPKDTRVFYDDCHFNENGAARVAEIVAKHFLEREPFK